jgi:tetratricopeptide (TPR) repeat protein
LAGVEEDGYLIDRANLAWLLWESDQPEKAVREMTRAVQMAPGGASGDLGAANRRLNLGFMLEGAHQTRAAQLEYARAVALAPGVLDTSFWEDKPSDGWACASAIQMAQDLQGTPWGDPSSLQRAEFAYFLRKWDVARAWADRALQEDPRQNAAWFCLGRIEMAAGYPGRAVNIADRMLQTMGITPASLVLRAMGNLELGNLDAAARDVQALRFVPVSYQPCLPYGAMADYLPHLLAARLAELQGQREVAVRELQSATRTDFANDPVQYGPDVWGRAALATETVPFLLQPIRTDAKVEAYLALGDLYARQGMTAQAREAFQAVLTLSPDHPGARQRLSDLPE